jgi:hypothetical protein
VVLRRRHKRRDATQWIDGEIGRISLSAAFDAHGFIGQSTVLQRNVRSQGARSGKIVQLHDSALEALTIW